MKPRMCYMTKIAQQFYFYQIAPTRDLILLFQTLIKETYEVSPV